jgi:hypothetical protein
MRVTGAAFEGSVTGASPASGGAISLSEDQADFCPHCRSPLEIVQVKFKFNGTVMISTCPNCAIASVDEWRAAEWKNLDAKKLALAVATRSVWQGVATRMDALDQRFRYILAFLIGAVITAAALRHVVHVYGGITREEIRAGALMSIPAVAFAIFLFRRNLQR